MKSYVTFPKSANNAAKFSRMRLRNWNWWREILTTETDVSATRAAALINLADIYRRLGEEEGTNAATRSFELYMKSLEQFEQLIDVERNRDPEMLWKYSVVLQRVVSDLVDGNQSARAEPYLERAVELRQHLAKEFPKNRDYTAGVVHILYESGEFLQRPGTYAQAIDAHENGLTVAQRLVKEYPDEPQD